MSPGAGACDCPAVNQEGKGEEMEHFVGGQEGGGRCCNVVAWICNSG